MATSAAVSQPGPTASAAGLPPPRAASAASGMAGFGRV